MKVINRTTSEFRSSEYNRALYGTCCHISLVSISGFVLFLLWTRYSDIPDSVACTSAIQQISSHSVRRKHHGWQIYVVQSCRNGEE